MRDGQEEVVSSRVQQVKGEEAWVARDQGARMCMQRPLIFHNYLALNLFKIQSISSLRDGLECHTEGDKQ